MNWMWLPLSLSIFGVDLIQRGLAAFAKMKDFGIPHLQEALSIYFLMMSIGVLACGYFCDNFNSRKILLWSTIAGALGILTLPYTPLGFGLIFGAAAAFIKISPFAAPLKLETNKDSLRIAPQASAKNIGGALFLLLLGTVFPAIGWNWSVFILASLFLAAGIATYKMVPDDKIEGWKWNVFIKLVKDWKFWLAMTYFFFMSGLYYIAIKGFIPALIKINGMDKSFAITLVAISFLIAGTLRFFWGWIGHRFPSSKLFWMIVGTIGMGLTIPLTNLFPLISLAIFTVMSAIHTPLYWAWCKEQWGPLYISTVLALGFSAMYLGSGVMYGAWTN